MSDLHIASAWEAIADLVGSRTALVSGDESRSWWEFDDRAARLATKLTEQGIGADSKVGLYLHNSNEYLEAQYAVFKTRGVPVNVSYRYKADELVYLLENSDAEVVFFQACYAMRIWEIYQRVEKVKLWIQVDDGTESVLDFAVDYEQMIRDHAPMERITRSASDVSMFYTGGATGMPKGVLYEQGEFVRAMLAGVSRFDLGVPKTIDEIRDVVGALADRRLNPVSLAACPLIQATGMWIGAVVPLLKGGTVVTINKLKFDPDLVWGEVERLRVTDLAIAGDAFAKPLQKAYVDADRRRNGYDIFSLREITSSGVTWSAEVKKALLELHDMTLIDTMIATEGIMGSSVSKRGDVDATARFEPVPGVKVFADDGSEVQPGSGVAGKIATSGFVPFGYYEDPEQSAATFPEIDGVRYAIPGDDVTVDADGSITFLGRGNQCIETDGEKVYPREIEEAIKRHPDVDDCLVLGTADEQMGQRVIAIVSADESATEEAVIAFAREQVAEFQAPRRILFVPEVQRLSTGTVNYKWAQQMADRFG